MFDGVLFGSVLRDLSLAWGRRHPRPKPCEAPAGPYCPLPPTYGRRGGLEAECVEDGVLAVRQHLFDPGIHAFRAAGAAAEPPAPPVEPAPAKG